MLRAAASCTAISTADLANRLPSSQALSITATTRSVSMTHTPLSAGANVRSTIPIIPIGVSGAYQPGVRNTSPYPLTPWSVVTATMRP